MNTNNENNLLAGLDLNDPTIAAFIAANAGKIAALKNAEKIAGLVADDLEALRAADAIARDAKNVTDQLGGVRASIWSSVQNVVQVVADNAKPEEREQLYFDVMGSILAPGTGPDGKALKLSTAGQYASTGRKMLTHLIGKGYTAEQLQEKTRAEVMALFKGADERARLEEMKDAAKHLRYIAKHGTADDWGLVSQVIKSIEAGYNAVHSRVNAGKNATDVAERPEMNEAAIIETVAAQLEQDGLQMAAGQ